MAVRSHPSKAVKIRSLVFVACLVLFVFLFFYNKTVGALKYTESKMSMGTFVKIDVCYRRGHERAVEAALNQVWEKMEDISWRMYAGNEGSDIFRLNNARGAAIKVGEDTYQILHDAQKFNALTKGAFDITVGPLMELWKGSAAQDRLPTQNEINLAKQSVGSQGFEFLPDFNVRAPHRETKVAFGGIAKGFAVDEAGKILKALGFDDFLIDAGGDLFAQGSNCQGKTWRIGIRDPRDASQLSDIILVKDAAVTTSGDYEQHYEIRGQRWSHIIDPVTGYPQKRVVSATVIAPNAQEADALSTALCVLGGEKGIALIDSLGDGYRALIIERVEGNTIKRYESKTYDSFRAKEM